MEDAQRPERSVRGRSPPPCLSGVASASRRTSESFGDQAGQNAPRECLGEPVLWLTPALDALEGSPRLARLPHSPPVTSYGTDEQRLTASNMLGEKYGENRVLCHLCLGTIHR